MSEIDVGELSRFCELPDDLTEDILAWLPVDYLCKFSSVSEKWKALFSSTRFITAQWLNKDPLLMLVAVNFHRDCFAYSSFTQSWKSCRLSLSFAEEREGAGFLVYIGSGAGLFLVGSIFTDSIYVCNPFTGNYFTLPHLTFTYHFLMGIVEEGIDGYKVVAVHSPGILGRHRVEIYDSRDKVWNSAGALQENLTIPISVKERGGLVFSGLAGFFYTLAFSLSDGVEGIARFNMVEGTCIFLPLPRPTENHIISFSYLVPCASRILLVAEMNYGTRVVLWEYIDDAVPKWEVIARMPQTVFPRNVRVREVPGRRLLHCAGMGDCIYFRFRQLAWKQFAVYNLTQNLWSLLPDFSFRGVENFVSPLFSFAPRLDMKVD